MARALWQDAAAAIRSIVSPIRMSTLEFKSPHDGSTLVFEMQHTNEVEAEFDVSVRTHRFTGRASASTFFHGSPAAMFSSMAKDWQRWNGQKSWSDLEGRVSLNATSDHTGHITLAVELRSSDDGAMLRTHLQFEAGQLDAMAADVASLFNE